MSLHIHDAVIWQESAQGISLYHTETGDFRTLNQSAAKIWAVLSWESEREAIVTRLSLLFGGTSEAIAARVRADVNRFLDAMVHDGLLAETEAASP